jgi:hypothetical protein
MAIHGTTISQPLITNAKLDKADIPLSGFAAAAMWTRTSFKLINVLDNIGTRCSD